MSPPLVLAAVHEAVLAAGQWMALGYFALVNLYGLLLVAGAALELRRHRLLAWHEGRWRLLASEAAPRISILAPAHNEALTVTESVRSLLTLEYPSLEVVVVNDGSSDATLEVLRRDFSLAPVHPIYRRSVDSAPVRGIYLSRTRPELVVVDKENGGKADALNAGLNVASGELACAIDADTIIEPDALLRMVRPFLFRDDVLAAGGTIRVVNGARVRAGRVVERRAPRRFLPAVQAVEYLRAFLIGRLGWNRLGGNLIISGAFGLFRRELTLAAGGYEHDSIGEDMELVVRLRRHAIEAGGPTHVHFVPDPVAWTEVPVSLRVLGRQRDRWHRGLADVLSRHRATIARRRYGTLGLVAMPYFLLIELLAPVMEAIGVVLLVVGLVADAVDISFAVLFLLVTYGLGLVVTVLSLLLEQLSSEGYGGVRERMLLFGFALVEPLGYRQLNVLWKLRGLVRYLRGNTEWGAMTRAGFGTVDSESRADP